MKDDKEHRDEIEPDSKPLPRITNGLNAGFVNGEFDPVRAFGSKKMGQGEINTRKEDCE